MLSNDLKIVEIYRGLWRIEESFKVTKTDLEARPVFVRKEDRIKAQNKGVKYHDQAREIDQVFRLGRIAQKRQVDKQKNCAVRQHGQEEFQRKSGI